jgi:hypothetical protein
MALMAAPMSNLEGRARFLTQIKGPMSSNDAERKDLLQRARDFERQCKVAGLFAILRQFGIMRYGPATPTPEQDLISIDKLGAFTKYKVLSGDQIKLRKARELSMDTSGSDELADQAFPSNSPLVDRYVHDEWLRNAFD